MRNAILLAAAFGMAVPTTAALAQESINVEYADLNLDTKEGQKKLDLRIRKAVESVCEVNAVQTGTRVRSNESRQCAEQAYASVKKQIAAKIENQKLGG